MSLMTCVASASAQDNTSAPTAVVVLDASGSMWGNLDPSTSKLAAARDALRKVLPTLDPRARVGITTFGGSCATTDQVVAPGSIPVADATRPLDRINPRGKGPLTLGLQEAAKAAGTGAPATLVLIHDGLDNCQQDPCAAAAELAKANPALRIDVLSLALERPDFRAIACVAKSAGGRHFDIRDTAGLEQALAEVLSTAPARPAAAAAVPAPKPAASPAPAARADGPPAISLTASLSDGGPALTDVVHWTILKPDGTPLQQHIGPFFNHDLAAGTYVVEARAGLAASRAEIEVAQRGLTTYRVALNAGRLSIVTTNGTTSPPAGDVLITVAEARADDTSSIGDRLPLWFTRAASAGVVVPAGSYRVAAQIGQGQAVTRVTIPPGKDLAVALQLGTGRLELTATGHAQGQAMNRVLFLIAVDDPDAPGGRREIARSAASKPVFQLPPGTYHVTARAGAVETRERIAIGAGDSISRKLNVPSARLTVAVSINGREPTADRQLVVDVARLAPTPERIARSGQARPEFILGEGRYVVTSELGAQNVRTATEVTLAAGESRNLDLRLDAGTLRLRHPSGGQVSLADALCETRDERGKLVWRTNRLDPHAELAPGQYRVTCGPKDRPIERSVGLAAGEQRTIDVVR